MKYPSLRLEDIYAVITYYLWHRREVDRYPEERRELEEEAVRAIEADFPSKRYPRTPPGPSQLLRPCLELN